MSIEAEIDAAFERMRAPYLRQIVDELKRAHSACVVREVSVCRCHVKECKWEGRIGNGGRKVKEVFAETENSFVGQSRCRRPAPVDREVFWCARRVHEIWRV